MRSAARFHRQHRTSALLERPALFLLMLAATWPACSVYQSQLLDDAAAVTEGGSSGGRSGGTGGSSSNGGAGKLGGSTGGGGKANSAAAGSTSTVAGAAGEDVGGTGSAAGSTSEPSAGSAGTSSGAGNGGSAGGDPGSLPGDLLDGFEDEDLVLEPVGGRGGVWYLFDDGSVGEAGPAPLTSSELLDAPALLGLFALHVTATGFTGWGSGLGVDFKAGKTPYDASSFSGIRFWARVGEGKNTRHRVQLVDATSDALGGKCNAATDAPDGEKCDDHFGKNLTLTSSWAQYVVPFAELSQIGWGKSAPALDEAALYGFQLTAKAKLNVDVWLDQVEFF